MTVGEIQELEGNALLVRGTAQGGEKHVDQAGVAGAFI
jgi:hypothetical protein